MKVYSSDTDQNLNGSAPTDEDEQSQEEYDYSQLFKAPNYADFIKLAPNSNARTYERKVASVMKAGLVMSLNNEQYPDAATFLKHGPGFATAAGNLAAVDAKAARLIDMITAPDSPYIMFYLAAAPLISQLARNHQPDIQQAGTTFRERRAQRKQERQAGIKQPQTPPITVRLGKRRITIPIRLRIRIPKLRNIFGAFLSPTQHPGQITQEVFQDPAVIKALHKMGIYPQGGNDAD